MNPPQVYLCSPCSIHLPPPSPYPPSGSSQCTSPKHPVSCIEPGLATRFIHDIIHVSMPFSQISPPSPSPLMYRSVYKIYSYQQDSLAIGMSSFFLREAVARILTKPHLKVRLPKLQFPQQDLRVPFSSNHHLQQLLYLYKV